MAVGTDGIRILHVDDDREFADLVATYLEREGERVDVVTAADVESALDRLAADDVDCVVSDYEMPDRNGIAFLETVRERYPNLPFVLFTGKGSEEVASSAISAGVTDYLQKGTGTSQFKILANRIENAVDQRRAERAAARSDERLRTVIDHVPHPIFVVGEDLTYRLSNAAHAASHGRTVAEIEGAAVDDVLDDDDVQSFDAAFREVVETGEPAQFSEVPHESPDGEVSFYDSRLVPFTPVRGQERAVLGVIVDVTERKRRERTLERLHEVTRELLEAESKEEVAQITTRAVRDVLGYPRNIVRLVDDEGSELHALAVSEEARELLGDRPVYPVGTGTAGRAFERGETLVYDDVREVDDGYDRRDARASMYLPIGEYGTVSICESEAGVFDDADVNLAEIFAANAEAALDRVEQARARERQNERLDEFTSIVSHDLQNPLSVLTMSLELAEERGDPEQFARCRRAVDRMDQLIDDLLTLARDGETVAEMESVDLATLVEACWQNVETGDASLAVEAAHVVRADAGRLRQVVENLLANAVVHGSTDADGGPAAGPVVDPVAGPVGDTVSVRVGELDDGFFVEDDGPGIAPDDREQVFERGYSTTNEGTGFGLAIVDRIVDAHGWHVTVTDGSAGGARFEVTGVTVEE